MIQTKTEGLQELELDQMQFAWLSWVARLSEQSIVLDQALCCQLDFYSFFALLYSNLYIYPKNDQIWSMVPKL